MKRLAITGIGFAVVAALALPGAVREVSAVVEHVCTTNSTPNACPNNNLYGTDIFAADTISGVLASANATLSSNLGNIVCTDSEVTGSSKSDGSSATITKLEFDNGTPTTHCTTTFFGTPSATITANNLNYNATITRGATCVGGKTGCDGTMQIQNINVTVALSNGITCTVTGSPTGNLYNKGNANAPVGGAGASHSELDFPGVTLSISGTFCPSTGTETATYYETGTNPAGTDLYLTP